MLSNKVVTVLLLWGFFFSSIYCAKMVLYVIYSNTVCLKPYNWSFYSQLKQIKILKNSIWGRICYKVIWSVNSLYLSCPRHHCFWGWLTLIRWSPQSCSSADARPWRRSRPPHLWPVQQGLPTGPHSGVHPAQAGRLRLQKPSHGHQRHPTLTRQPSQAPAHRQEWAGAHPCRLHWAAERNSQEPSLGGGAWHECEDRTRQIR